MRSPPPRANLKGKRPHINCPQPRLSSARLRSDYESGSRSEKLDRRPRGARYRRLSFGSPTTWLGSPRFGVQNPPFDSTSWRACGGREHLALLQFLVITGLQEISGESSARLAAAPRPYRKAGSAERRELKRIFPMSQA